MSMNTAVSDSAGTGAIRSLTSFCLAVGVPAGIADTSGVVAAGSSVGVRVAVGAGVGVEVGAGVGKGVDVLAGAASVHPEAIRTRSEMAKSANGTRPRDQDLVAETFFSGCLLLCIASNESSGHTWWFSRGPSS